MFRSPSHHDLTVRHQLENVHWMVAGDWDHILFSQEINCWSDWLKSSHKIEKQGVHRSVYQINHSKKSFFLKHSHDQRLTKALTNLIRGSAARREWIRSEILRSRGIDTVRVIAIGELSKFGLVYDNFVITEPIPSSQSLFQYLGQDYFKQSEEAESVLSLLMYELGVYCAKLHMNGVLHDDFHSGNILIQTDFRSNRFYLIDIPSIQIKRSINLELSCLNLAVLTSGLLHFVTSDHIRKLVEAYHVERTDISLPAISELSDQIIARSQLHARNNLIRRDKRCLHSNKDYEVIDTGRSTGYSVKGLSEELLDQKAVVKNEITSTQWNDQSLLVERVTEDKNGNTFSVEKLKEIWQVSQAIQTRFIPAQRVLAMMLPSSKQAANGFIVQEHHEDLVSIPDYFSEFTDDSKNRRIVLQKLGTFLGKLDYWGISSLDQRFHWLSVITENDEPEVILSDTSTIQIARDPQYQLTKSEIAAFVKNSDLLSHLKPSEQLIILKNYLNEVSGRVDSWKDLWVQLISLVKSERTLSVRPIKIKSPHFLSEKTKK